jgi:hypothetical protein
MVAQILTSENRGCSSKDKGFRGTGFLLKDADLSNLPFAELSSGAGESRPVSCFEVFFRLRVSLGTVRGRINFASPSETDEIQARTKL